MLTPEYIRASQKLDRQCGHEDTYSLLWHHNNPEPRMRIDALRQETSGRLAEKFIVTFDIDPESGIRRMFRRKAEEPEAVITDPHSEQQPESTQRKSPKFIVTYEIDPESGIRRMFRRKVTDTSENPDEKSTH